MCDNLINVDVMLVFAAQSNGYDLLKLPSNTFLSMEGGVWENETKFSDVNYYNIHLLYNYTELVQPV